MNFVRNLFSYAAVLSVIFIGGGCALKEELPAGTTGEGQKVRLSDTPDEKGSKGDTGKNGSYHRGALCGTMLHKATGRKIFFMVSHGCLDADDNAKYSSLYTEYEAKFNPDGLPSFFVGDLNTKPESASSTYYRTYWNDTFMTIDPSLREGCEPTYNGFKHEEGTSRIDFLYYRGADVTPTYYKCDNTLYDGLYPSDHWPVFADFTIE